MNDTLKVPTKKQEELLIKLECRYKIKIDYSKMYYTLSCYATKIKDIIKNIEQGKIISREKVLNYDEIKKEVEKRLEKIKHK